MEILKCVFSICIPDKPEFGMWKEDIEDVHREYADKCDADYFLYENHDSFPDTSKYDSINYSKYSFSESLTEKYDQVLFLDFDVLPFTDVSIFDTFDFDKGVLVKKILDYKSEIVKKYYDTYNATKEYQSKITRTHFHGTPWHKEPRPDYFLAKYDLNWWMEKNNLDLPRIGIGEILENDDISKLIKTHEYGGSSLYNTGVLGFTKKTIQDLDIFNNFLPINNEVQFSYKAKTCIDIGDEWNHFIDWNSSIQYFYDWQPSIAPKFIHVLDKRFDKYL